MDYPAENWRAFGRYIKATRKRRGSGYADTQGWAARVGRSSRVLLGLERGEPVGDDTVLKIADALGIPAAQLFQELEHPGFLDSAPSPLADDRPAPGSLEGDLARIDALHIPEDKKALLKSMYLSWQPGQGDSPRARGAS